MSETQLTCKHVEEGFTISDPVKSRTNFHSHVGFLEHDESGNLSFNGLHDVMKFFGYDADPDENIADVDWCNGYAGIGWYIWCHEYPDEGCVLISKNEKPSLDMLLLMPEFFDVVEFADL